MLFPEIDLFYCFYRQKFLDIFKTVLHVLTHFVKRKSVRFRGNALIFLSLLLKQFLFIFSILLLKAFKTIGETIFELKQINSIN